MKRKVIKAFALVFCLALCVAAMTVNTFAYTRIDTERETSLTLVFETEEAPFSNAKFKLYRIADVSDAVDYTLTENFAGSGIKLADMTADSWQKTTDTLVKYIKDNKIAPVAEKATDAEGIVTFAGQEVGLYLVTGEVINTGKEIYTPTAFMVNLPNLEQEIDTWDYEAVVNVKYTKEVIPVVPQTGDITNMTYYIVLAVYSVIGLLCVGYVYMRRRVHS